MKVVGAEWRRLSGPMYFARYLPDGNFSVELGGWATQGHVSFSVTADWPVLHGFLPAQLLEPPFAHLAELPQLSQVGCGEAS